MRTKAKFPAYLSVAVDNFCSIPCQMARKVATFRCGTNIACIDHTTAHGESVRLTPGAAPPEANKYDEVVCLKNCSCIDD